MQLWVFNHYAETPEGSATRTFELSRALVQRGHAVTIFACSFSHYRLREEKLERPWRFVKVEYVDGVRFVWLYGLPYQKNDTRRVANMLSFTLLGMWKGLWQSPKPDVIVGCSVHPGAALVGLLLSHLRQTRFLVEVPDLWPQVLIDFGRIQSHGLLARTLRVIEKVLYDRAEWIVMLWRNTEAYVRSRGVSVAKVVWIPHVIDFARAAEAPHPLMRSNPRRFTIMYLGSFVQSTALDVLLDAAALLLQRGQHEIHIVLVGGGVDRPRIIARAESLQLTNVEIREPVPKREVAAVMREADCFVCCIKRSPVYSYGVSMNKLCDYLMSGKPVVFSGDSAYDPVFEANAGFSVPAEDPHALAEGMIRMLILSDEERCHMGERGLAWVRKYHDINVLTDRLESLITA